MWRVRDETMGGAAERGRRQGWAGPPAQAQVGRGRRRGESWGGARGGARPGRRCGRGRSGPRGVGRGRRRGGSATPAWGEVGWDLGEMGSWGE